MRVRKGFLLIECCIYIAICALLTATLMHWISQTIIEAGQHTTMIQKGITNALMHDVIRRDMQRAPHDEKLWVGETSSLIWKIDEKNAIGWSIDHKKLIRKEGLYDKTRKQWGKHHTSAIAYNVHLFRCNTHKNETGIQGVEVTIGIDGENPSTQYIRLRNGRSM